MVVFVDFVLLFNLFILLFLIKQLNIKNNKILKSKSKSNNSNVLYVIKMDFSEFRGTKSLDKFLIKYFKIMYWLVFLISMVLIIFIGAILINENISFKDELVFAKLLIYLFITLYILKAVLEHTKRACGEITINILKEGIQYCNYRLGIERLLKWNSFEGYRLKNNSISLYGNSKISILPDIFKLKYQLKYSKELENIIRKHLKKLD
jgi:hypothetical protein